MASMVGEALTLGCLGRRWSDFLEVAIIACQEVADWGEVRDSQLGSVEKSEHWCRSRCWHHNVFKKGKIWEGFFEMDIEWYLLIA